MNSVTPLELSLASVSRACRGWLQYYRLCAWHSKVSNARLLLYPCLAYAVAGSWPPAVLLLNTLALAGLVAFQGALNDYWDFRASGERNCLGAAVEARTLTHGQAVLRLAAPLLLAVPALIASPGWASPGAVQGLLAAGAVLAAAYSVPPLRFKTRRPAGALMAPLLTTLMFLEAHLAIAPLTPAALQLAVLLTLFQSYAEMLHVIREAELSGRAEKCPPRLAVRWSRMSPLVSGLCAAAFAAARPMFLLGVCCSALRWRAVRNTVPGQLVSERPRLFSPLLSVYEFLGYAAAGALRLLSLALCLAAGQGLLNAPAQAFERALEPRSFAFPADHGPHPSFRTEWWYFAGVLRPEGGATYGVQATWFRSGETLMVHTALTDAAQGRFAYAEAACQAGEDACALSPSPMAATVGEHRLRQLPDGRFELTFAVDGRTVQLRAQPEQGPVLHGPQPGLSQKGAQPGEASFQVSYPRLAAEGTVTASDGSVQGMSGQLWFDHEFGTDQLGERLAGWDWLSVVFDEGGGLMVYGFRPTDAAVPPRRWGTVIDAAGAQRHVPGEEIVVDATGQWTSPGSGATYPSGWVVRIPAEELELRVTPVLQDQELRTGRTTGITYWEGLCRFEGTRRGAPVVGFGYVELTGYAESLAGRI